MRHDWLKGKCKAGKVSVYSVKTSDAKAESRDMNELVGPAHGGGLVFIMTKRKLATQLMARDQEAWPIIQRDADNIQAVLECRRCHEQHVLVRAAVSGIEALTAPRIGRVGADRRMPTRYEGMPTEVRFDVTHDADWFEFRAPMMMETEGTSHLTCQKCGEASTPKVRLS